MPSNIQALIDENRKIITVNGEPVVLGTIPDYCIEKTKDTNNVLQQGSKIIKLDGTTGIGDYALAYTYYRNNSISGNIDLSGLTSVVGSQGCGYMFYGSTNITSVDLSSLESTSGMDSFFNAFSSCTALSSVDLSSLQTLTGGQDFNNAFYNCTSLTSIDLSSLITIDTHRCFYHCFENCINLASVDLSNLTTITYTGHLYDGWCFNNAFTKTKLTTVSFDSLQVMNCSNIFYETFNNCTSLTSLSFPALTSTSFGTRTNQFGSMLKNVTGCTVHFPSNLQSVIGSWTDVTSGFGGTNTTVLWDLPATNTLTGVDTTIYTRNPKYDTATALAWKVGAYGTTNFEPVYYTSGLTNPVVGTTIYSDLDCTTSETTVASIA